MKRNFTILVLLCLSVLMVNAQFVWVQKANLPATGRYGSEGFTINNKGYIVCGNDVSLNYYTDLWQYNDTTNAWTQMASMSIAARTVPSVFVINNKAYVGLGHTSGNIFNDMQEYDPATNAWTTKSSLPDTVRYGAAAFAINNKGYVVFGNEGSSGGPFTNTTWAYTPTSDTWAQVAACPASPRYGAIGFSLNNKGYAGFGYDNSNFYSDLWEYNDTTNSWTQKASYPVGMAYPTMFPFNNMEAIGTGGTGTGNLRVFYTFDDLNNTWNAIPSLPSGYQREAAAGFNIMQNGYVATGLDSTSAGRTDLWELVNTTGINTITNNENSVNIYPNPASTDFNINYKLTSSNETFLLIDETGKVVKTIYLKGIEGNQNVNISEIDNGVYLWEMIADKGVLTQGKIVVIK